MPPIVPNRSSIVKDYSYPLKHVVHSHHVRVKPPRDGFGADKNMTICAGFICRDGLLLTADTEITAGGGKYDARKIRRRNFIGGECVIGGAGNMSFVGMASDMIAEELYRHRMEFSDEEDVRERKSLFFDLVQRTILTIHRDHIASYPYQDAPPGFGLIIGVHLPGLDEMWELELLHCAGDGGVYWTRENLFEGTGAPIARRFAEIICEESVPLDLMRTIAVFCLHQAKLSAEGCGGSTHSHIVPIPTFNTIWDEKTVAEVAETAVRLCMLDARDTRLNKEKFQAKVDKFMEKLMAIRSAVEQQIISRNYIIEMIRTVSVTSSPNAPEPPPEQSDGAPPGSDS
jgi:hypothetical protein